MSKLEPLQERWKPPRWMFAVGSILLVAWWLSTQPPPQGERPAAPSADQDAAFEPSIPVVNDAIATTDEDAIPVIEPGSNAPESIVDTPQREASSPRVKDDVPAKPRNKTPSISAATKSTPNTDTKKTANDPLIIVNVTIKDQSGRVAFKGDVDLHPTFERIERGEKFPHRNDGSTFRNLEGRLPKKPAGYYTEYVQPTPGMGGPGPQRIVIGKNGEAFYTHDHYNSFRKVRG